MCGHVVRYVLRARAASRSRATSKPGARLCRLPPRASSASAPPSLCLPVSARELISMDSVKKLREASGIRPPTYPAEALPLLSWSCEAASALVIYDAAVCVCTPKGQLPP